MSFGAISVKIGNQQDYKIKGAGFNPGIRKIVEMMDVEAKAPQQDDVLIYNNLTGKYESRGLEYDDLNITNIDAGIF